MNLENRKSANQFIHILDNAAITTKFVFKDNSPILYVYNYEDGMWQFSGNEEVFKEEDYLVVSIAEILDLDSSMNELPHLLPGYFAQRKDINKSWMVEAIRE